MVGAQPQPRREVLGAGPLRHVRADFADHLQGGESVNAGDAGQVYPSHPVQMCLDVEAGRVALTLPTAIVAWRPAVAAVLEPLQLGFDLLVINDNKECRPVASPKNDAPIDVKLGS